MGVHDGHRERRRERFRESGLKGFADHEALELLLFYAIRRGDVNDLAHRLIDHFGSLKDVLTAPLDELAEVPGVGPHTALLLGLVVPLVYSSETVYSKKPVIFSDSSQAGAYFIRRFEGEREEILYEACLDAKGKLLRCEEIGRGSVDTVTLSLRRIVEVPFRCNASSVMLAHNHPSGLALPSEEDNRATLLAGEALEKIGIRLLDHIIVADRDYVSLRSNGLLPIRRR